jgi:hypothetical protein
LSRNVFFRHPVFIDGLLLTTYGCLIAIGTNELIAAFHPSPWIKWIFGYGAGAYLAFPAYALAPKLTDDPSWAWRLEEAGGLPLVSYVAFLAVWSF